MTVNTDTDIESPVEEKARVPVAATMTVALATASLVLSTYCLDKPYATHTYLILFSEAFPAFGILVALAVRSVTRSRWTQLALIVFTIALALSLRQVINLFATDLGRAVGGK